MSYAIIGLVLVALVAFFLMRKKEEPEQLPAKKEKEPAKLEKKPAKKEAAREETPAPRKKSAAETVGETPAAKAVEAPNAERARAEEEEALGRWQRLSAWRKGIAIGGFAAGTFGLGFTLGGLVFGRWRKA